MSSKSTGRFQTPGALYAAFLKAVVLDVPSALRLVGEAAFPGGPESPPSPVLIEAGDWDDDEEVAMVPCVDGACKAEVAGAEQGRFCFARSCPIISHRDPKNKFELQDGWYVRGGPRDAQGAHATPYLPSRAVPTAVALTFTQKSLPLKMTLGMWNLLCQDYAAGEEAEMSLILISSEPDTAHLFADGIDILEDYHLARSFHRGASTRATIAGQASATSATRPPGQRCRWRLGPAKCSMQTFQSQIGSGGGVQCHGVDLGGYRECEDFYNSANINIGAYQDAFAMAHAIKTTAVHEPDALRNREARTKVKFDNPLEGSVITSFGTLAPSILAASEKPAHAAISEHLKSFKDFKTAGP
jgi:hypothetical protein